jgi:hypothetical protein
MLIAHATRILLLALAATPFALLVPGLSFWLWGLALAVAALLACADFLDVLDRGL